MPSPTSLQDTALDHLRVIRTLMERASIYRAVSAPAALIGGALALGAPPSDTCSPAGPGESDLPRRLDRRALSHHGDQSLPAHARSRRERPAARHATACAWRCAPSCRRCSRAACWASCLILDDQRTLGALVWILCYGLALQATVGFAPRSIIRLARAFLIAGQAHDHRVFRQRTSRVLSRRPEAGLAAARTDLRRVSLVYGVAVYFWKAKAADTAKRNDGRWNNGIPQASPFQSSIIPIPVFLSPPAR